MDSSGGRGGCSKNIWGAKCCIGLDIAFFSAFQVASPIVIPQSGTATGIVPIVSCSDVKVYPTLVNSNVTLAFNLNTAARASAILVSTNGIVNPLFANVAIEQGIYDRTVDLSSMPAGIYFLRMNIGSETFVTKLLKQ